MKNKIIIGTIFAIIASISWGAMFPVAHHAFLFIDPFYFTIIRYVPVSIILVIILFMMEGRKAFKLEGNGFTLWLYGTFGFTIYNLFIFWGQSLLGDAGIILASIMEALAPIISVLIIWIIHNRRPYPFTIFTIIGAFIGVILVVTNGNIHIIFASGRIVPLLILLFAATGWAVYTIGGGVFQHWSVLRYSALSSLLGTLTATVVVFTISFIGLIDVPTLEDIYIVRYHMLFMIIFPGLIALLFWNKGVSILKPMNAILFINFVPVTTVLIRLIQGHQLSIYEIIGIFIVCTMIILNNIYQRMMLQKNTVTHQEEKRSA